MAPDQEPTGTLEDMGPLELDGAQTKNQRAPRAAGCPPNREQTGLFADHGTPGARWGPGSRDSCPLEQAGAIKDPYSKRGLLNREQINLFEDHMAMWLYFVSFGAGESCVAFVVLIAVFPCPLFTLTISRPRAARG